MGAWRVWLLLGVVLLCQLRLGHAYSITLVEQTITVDSCNVSVAELITVQPDPQENVTVFTREILLARGWRFMMRPSISTTLQDVTFSDSDDDTIITILIDVPPLSAFNVSISYALSNVISTLLSTPLNLNTFSWVISPPATGTNVTGSGVRFVGVFIDQPDNIMGTMNAAALDESTIGNDTYLTYNQPELVTNGRISIVLSWQSTAACVVKIEVRELRAGAVVGIVIGTLVGTVALLLVLNLICGFFAPKDTPR